MLRNTIYSCCTVANKFLHLLLIRIERYLRAALLDKKVVRDIIQFQITLPIHEV